MSKKNKPRRPKRRGPEQPRHSVAPARVPEVVSANLAGLSSGFNRLARKSCSECGAPVEWVDADHAREHGMNVEEALDFLGLGQDARDSVEWWICTKCDNAGVMGSPLFG